MQWITNWLIALSIYIKISNQKFLKIFQKQPETIKLPTNKTTGILPRLLQNQGLCDSVYDIYSLYEGNEKTMVIEYDYTYFYCATRHPTAAMVAHLIILEVMQLCKINYFFSFTGRNTIAIHRNHKFCMSWFANNY